MGKSLTSTTPLIVEFVGLPGAGKTTVAQQVALKLREQGLRVVCRAEILNQWQKQNVLQKAMELFPNSLNHWHILINSLIFAGQVKPINRQSFTKATKIFTNVKRNDTVARDRDCDIVLLDQGLLQETWSVSITGSPPQTKFLKREITPLFDNRATLIVYCQLDVVTALKRMQNRQTKNSRFDLMNSTLASSTMKKYVSYMEEIINSARDCNVPVLELDSYRAIELQSNKAVDLIRKKRSLRVS